MTHTSSAVPAALQQYAETEQQRADALRHEARLLAAALDHFAATCTEFPTGIDGALARPMVEHASAAHAFGVWVGQVGAAFRQADQGALPASPRIAISTSLRVSLARSSPEIAPALDQVERAIAGAMTLVHNAMPGYQAPAGPFAWLPELSTIGWVPGLGCISTRTA